MAGSPGTVSAPEHNPISAPERRKQSQQSSLAKLVMSTHLAAATSSSASESSSPKQLPGEKPPLPFHFGQDGLLPLPAHAVFAHALRSLDQSPADSLVPNGIHGFNGLFANRPSIPYYESPYTRSNASTAPGSPRIPPLRQNSGSHTPRIRPHATSLNIPGMTRSKVSPDGRIPDRDVAAKLVIIMVGLPARGKSYITKKIQRYLSWQQHNTRIFNVGNRRRIAAGVASALTNPTDASRHVPRRDQLGPQPDAHAGAPLHQATSILLNGVEPADIDEPTALDLNSTAEIEGGKSNTDGVPVNGAVAETPADAPLNGTLNGTTTETAVNTSVGITVDGTVNGEVAVNGTGGNRTVDGNVGNEIAPNGSTSIEDGTTTPSTAETSAAASANESAKATATQTPANGTVESEAPVADTKPDLSGMDQSAKFFHPQNESASKLREQVALETLDELLDYLLDHNGAVGILDATNSTLHRRKLLVDHIKAREPKLGILFIESVCNDENLLEANMRLKLSGPDYKNKDPVKSLEDFKARVEAYESAYEPLGDYEEKNDLQYIKMIDVGRKVVHYRLNGFLSSGIASYLTTFNLSPRQIWITRHGQSMDNVAGKLGGDSELTERGHYYGQALYNFITTKRKEWVVEQENKIARASFPPLPGDRTPPYPELNQELEEKNFCVWTSMLKRSVETAEYFEADDDYDVKAWEMLNELNAGTFEGLTYSDIASKYPEEYRKRHHDKLHYIYPGVGGEGYLQVINRLRDMVREMERVTDHVLIISHRSVCRVLMAYFMDLTRDDIAELDVPLGMIFAIHPKPYGMEFHAYRYNEPMGWFDEVPDYKPTRTVDQNN